MPKIFKSCLDNWVLSEEEIKKIIDNAKLQLKNIFGLDIVSDNTTVFKCTFANDVSQNFTKK